MPDVSIIIVSFNARDFLERCLDTVVGRGHEVIVVDNASSDESSDLVRDRFPTVRLLALPTNLGFGVANNEGMRIASGRHFLLLNPDAWPVDDAIEKLVEFADRNPHVAMVGPRLVNPDGSLQRSIRGYPTVWWRGAGARRKRRPIGTLVFRLRWLIPKRMYRRPHPSSSSARPTTLTKQFLRGAVLLIRREAAEQVGGFDPNFFLYAEELDLCYRLQKTGWLIEFFPEATFVHITGASTHLDWPKAYREQLRGHLRFLAKHQGLAQAERSRRILAVSLRVRQLLSSEDASMYRDLSNWLAASDAKTLLAEGQSPSSTK